MLPDRLRARTVSALQVARIWLPRGLALAAFCLYAVVAPPGFYWLDSGELAASAIAMGSPHPTGFPLYCALARAAAFVPLGELGFRVELLSAACASLSVLWTARLVWTMAGPGKDKAQGDARRRDEISALVGGAGAAIALGVSLVFLRQATVVEVYAPVAALVSGTLILIDRVARGGGARWGLALALICGLGLSVHVTFALLGPPVVALLVLRLRRGARWPLVAPLLCLFTLASSLLYLPTRSATGRVAAVDWGHPDDLGSLVDHVSAGRIRRAYGDQMRSSTPAVIAHNASVFGDVASRSIGPFTLLAALAGAFWLVRRRSSRWIAVTVLWLAIADAIYAVWINPMGMTDLQNTILLSLAAYLFAGVGLAWFARVLGRVGPFAGAVAGLILALPAALLALSDVWPASQSDGPRRWAEAALADTPPRGIALVESDSTAAGLIYLTAAEGARPDVAVLVRQHLGDVERTREVLAASGGDSATFDSAAAVASLLDSNRPVAWEIGVDAIPAGARLRAGAPLSRLTRSSGDTGDRTRVHVDRRAKIRAAAEELNDLVGGERDPAGRRAYAHGLTALGRLAYGGGDLELADVLFELAVGARPEHIAAWINRGVVASRRSDWQAALAHSERALSMEPIRVSALVNAIRFSIQLGDDRRAQKYLDRALDIAPDRADVWALAALLDLRGGRSERAVKRLQRALDIDPRDPDAVDLVRQLEARR